MSHRSPTTDLTAARPEGDIYPPSPATLLAGRWHPAVVSGRLLSCLAILHPSPPPPRLCHRCLVGIRGYLNGNPLHIPRRMLAISGVVAVAVHKSSGVGAWLNPGCALFFSFSFRTIRFLWGISLPCSLVTPTYLFVDARWMRRWVVVCLVLGVEVGCTSLLEIDGWNQCISHSELPCPPTQLGTGKHNPTVFAGQLASQPASALQVALGATGLGGRLRLPLRLGQGRRRLAFLLFSLQPHLASALVAIPQHQQYHWAAESAQNSQP